MLHLSLFLLVFSCLLCFSFFYLSKKLSHLSDKQHKKKIYILVAIIELIIFIGFIGLRLIKPQNEIPFLLHAVAWISYTLMGFLSFTMSLFLLSDILFYLKSFFTRNKKEIDLNKRKFITSGVFIAATTLTGKSFYNAVTFPKLKNVSIFFPFLPAELENFRIIQITDLHFGLTLGKEYCEDIVDKINHSNADIIAITGDIADGFPHQLKSLMESFSQLKSKYGVYYVTGNHEYYWGAEGWINHLKSLGAIYLENEHKIIDVLGHKIALAGVPDLTSKNYDVNKASSPQKAILNCPADVTLKICLAHQPKSAFDAADAGFHLQLSGHTHGGQFWPWTWVIPLVQPFVAGLTHYKNMKLYVSRGTGYWGPPARLGSPSEITVIELKNGKDLQA